MVYGEGTELEYRCDDGLYPNGTITSVCIDSENRRDWVPNPVNESCHKPGMTIIMIGFFWLNTIHFCPLPSCVHDSTRYRTRADRIFQHGSNC